MPRFETEAEEAQWWFDHREELAEDIVAAARRRGLGEGSFARSVRKRKKAETVPALNEAQHDLS